MKKMFITGAILALLLTSRPVFAAHEKGALPPMVENKNKGQAVEMKMNEAQQKSKRKAEKKAKKSARQAAKSKKKIERKTKAKKAGNV